MARINVEDDWFEDATKRRAALKRAVEQLPRDTEREADGYALDAWRLGQRYWKDGKKLVPEEVWARSGLEPLIAADLAERRPQGIYVRGAEAQHDWVLQHSIAGKIGGKRSAESRRKKYGTEAPLRKSRSAGEAPLRKVTKRHEALTKPLPLYTFDKPDSDNDPEQIEAETARIALSEPKGTDVWARYSAAYHHRYGVMPARNSKVNRHCADLVKRLGGDAAVAVVGFYLQHNDAYYVRRTHDIALCVANAEGLFTQMRTGKTVTAASAAVKDRQQSNADAMREALQILEARDAKK